MITMTVCFLSWATELFGLHRDLLYPHRNSRYLHGSLTPTQKFWISPRGSYTYSEILDISTGLLHPHRNSGYFHGSLMPHRNSGYLHGSLAPTQKFWISSRVSYTHTGSFGYYRESPSPNFQAFHLRGLTTPFLLNPTHINYLSFPDLNYESSLDVVPKTNSTHTHPEW